MQSERQLLIPRGRKIRLGARNLWSDFKKFIDKGNVMDLAVGIVIGNAFSEVVTSFVSDIFTPILGLVVSSKLSETFVTIRKGPHFPYNTRDEAKADGAITWNYGNFMQLMINFFLISASIFIVVRMFQSMKKRKIEEDIQSETMKECHLCFTKIDGRAVKCPACTANI